jgi:hypothetical protein
MAPNLSLENLPAEASSQGAFTKPVLSIYRQVQKSDQKMIGFAVAREERCEDVAPHLGT